MENKVIAVWFSCGAASAVAAKKTIEMYGDKNTILIVNNPVKEEHEDNQRFLKDCERWFGLPIIQAINEKIGTTSVVDVFDKQKWMGGIKGAPCTSLLKKEARYQFELKNHIDFHVLGFTYDEEDRHKRFTTFERKNALPILIDLKLTKDMCFEIIYNAGIKLPEIYAKGFPNANCIGCVKANSASYWNLVRKEFPDVFNERAEQSRRIGAKLVRVKGVRMFLDELNPKEKSRKIKSWECGIFCQLPNHKK